MNELPAEHPLRSTPRTAGYTEYLLRRLTEVETERNRALADLARANRALFSCAKQVTELRARLGAEKP